MTIDERLDRSSQNVSFKVSPASEQHAGAGRPALALKVAASFS